MHHLFIYLRMSRESTIKKLGSQKNKLIKVAIPKMDAN